jgi:hypothetical protein
MNALKQYMKINRISFTEASGIDDCFVPEARAILVNSRLSSEMKKITLLHELGHFLIMQSRIRNKGKEYMCMTFDEYTDNPTNRRKRLGTIMEEIEAWQRGLKLAKRLKIRINTRKFDKERVRCLQTYVRWASK